MKLPFPRWFLDTQEGQRIQRAEQEATAARRDQLAREIAAQRAHVPKALAEIDPRLARATATRDDCLGKLKTAQGAVDALVAERAACTHAADRAILRAESELRNTCDPAIAEFRDELVRGHDALRFRSMAFRINPDHLTHDRLLEVLATVLASARALDDLELAPVASAAEGIAALRQRIADAANGDGSARSPDGLTPVRPAA